MNLSGRPPSPAPVVRPLAIELAQLRDAFEGRPATLREMIGILGDRAYQLLLMLCTLPFLLPVSLPGTSTPFGLAVAIISLQLAFGRLPWLPSRLLDKQLAPGFLTKVVAVTRGVVGFVEKALRPQLPALTGARWLVALHYLTIGVAGLVLTLPLPLPLTNTFPAWTILFLALGLLERDGLFVLAGYVMALATVVWFTILGAAVHQTLAAMWHWLVG